MLRYLDHHAKAMTPLVLGACKHPLKAGGSTIEVLLDRRTS